MEFPPPIGAHQRRHLTPPAPSGSLSRRGFIALATTIILGACAMTTEPAAQASAFEQATGKSPGLLPSSIAVTTTVGRLAVRVAEPQTPSGEVIVLWPSILADHRIYRRQIEAWRGRHRLVIIDGPGHGESGPAPGPFTMAECGRAVGEVLDALGIAQPVVIVGTSWGGLVAGEFAMAQPKRTRAVVMLNTPVYTAPDGPGFGDRFIVWGARWIHGTGVYRDGVAKAFFLPATRERGGSLIHDFHQHLREVDGAALAQSVRSVLLEREPLAPRMSQIAAPTLFVAGRHDGMYPMEDLRKAAAALPRGRFEVLETGHISVVDEPDKTSALITDFLGTLPAGSR